MDQGFSFWRWDRVRAETGFSRTTIYRLIDEGKFPRPVKIGERASAWRSDLVQAWMASRVEASQASGAPLR
jgi:prophage regulatory protein